MGLLARFLAVLVLASPWPAAAESLDAALASVVSILPDWPPDARRMEEPEASGIALLDGRTIATAAHVVDKARAIRVRTHDGRIMSAEFLARDADTDIAILAVQDALPPMALAAGELALGQSVCAIGNAFGLGLSVTCGVVSGVHRAGVGFNRIEDFVQTDAAVNPGASGGALVKTDGKLVGLLSAIFTKRSDANVGVNFAVSARLVARVARQLKNAGRVIWPDAGLRLVKAPGKGATGLLAARVLSVNPGLPADKAGLKPGDLILKAGERRIRKPADFTSALALLVSPATVAVLVERAGTEQTFMLQL